MITDASELCLACGLCCSGSIFSEALVDPETDAEPLSSSTFDRAELDGRPAFSLGCKHLRGATCQIYDQQRPRVCGAFDCSVLHKWKHRELSGEAAMEKIKEAVGQDADVRASLSDLGVANPRNLAGAKLVLEARLKTARDEKEKRQIGEALVKLTAYRLFLKKVFLSGDQQQEMAPVDG